MTRIVSTGILSNVLLAASLVSGQAPDAPQAIGGQRSLETAAEQSQYAFLLFHRNNDAATQAMQQVLQGAVAENQQVTIVSVNINDAGEQQLVERFDASRTPMPAVVALAPNGAVTGVFAQRVTPQQLDSAIVSSGEADCVKALQDQKLVLLCLHAAGDDVVPTGVSQFLANDEYMHRSRIVQVMSDDPAEARFIKQLGLPQSSSDVVFMAPPGVMIGTFHANVSEATLVQKLVAAGKCCDDPNCKHRRSAKGNRRARR